MRTSGWNAAAGGVALVALASWLISGISGNRTPPVLAVVASHSFAVNHKIAADDLSFALLQSYPPLDGVERPEAALGACTRAELKEGEPVAWHQLNPPGTGDDTCASAAVALSLVEKILRIPNTPSDPATASSAGPQPAGGVAHPSQWLKAFTEPVSELSASTRSAIGEFRSEFMKEFGKHLGDNSADRAFGRDTRGGGVKADGGSVPPKNHSKIEPSERLNVTYFDLDRSDLRQDQRDTLVQFTAGLSRQQGCRIVIHAYADRTGGQRYNLWLSWQRGSAVARILISGGIDRRQLVWFHTGTRSQLSSRSPGCPLP